MSKKILDFKTKQQEELDTASEKINEVLAGVTKSFKETIIKHEVEGVIIISYSLIGKYDFEAKKKMIGKAGLLAGLGLFIIYGGLIALGAFNSGNLEIENRTELLTILSSNTLGNMGAAFLAVLVALACFTTAVGIVTGTADFVKGLFSNSNTAYVLTAILGCILGIVIGQFDVHYIIDIALPALMFIYPITIVLILLNVLPKRFASNLVFRAVVVVTFFFSIPDFLGFIIAEEKLVGLKNSIPLANENMGWVLPAVIVFVGVTIIEQFIFPKQNVST